MESDKNITDRAKNFIATINKGYGCQVAEVGGKFSALNIPRYSSGILSLDVALGGGWPFGKISVTAGEYSTGKTLLSIKACQSVENYDHATKLHKDYVKDNFEPGTALVVDMENSWDMVWAKANGFDADRHVVARPEYSQQAADIITRAIRENTFDLIIVDSIAEMTPSEEIEESSEDWQMGLAARVNNKAIRRWNGSLRKMTSQGTVGPHIMMVNQFRMKLGMVFGDPRTLPGGKAQEFCSSIIVYTKSQKYEDTASKEIGSGKYRGVVWKNKTYVTRQNYEFNMYLRDCEEGITGKVDNEKQLVKMAKKYRLLVKDKKWKFGTQEFNTEREVY